MKKNVGKTDRIIRIVLGVVIAGLGIYFKSWFGLVAIIPLGTGLIGWCGIYTACGTSTCPMKTAESEN